MAIPREAKKHTLGRGEVHFALFKPGTQEPDGFRYLGNTTELNVTIETENLDHYDSDHGIREKDDSLPLETNRTGSLVTDHINPQNVALFFFGSTSVLAQAAAADQSYTITGARAGLTYQIGLDDDNPTGLSGLENATLTVGATPLVADTDYEIDLDTGLVTFSSALGEDGEALAAPADVTVDFGLRAMSRTQIISGSEPIEGALLYKSFNPKGDRIDFRMPYVKLSPNGDFALKSEEWQTIPLSLEILKAAGKEAIYGNGRPMYVNG